MPATTPRTAPADLPVLPPYAAPSPDQDDDYGREWSGHLTTENVYHVAERIRRMFEGKRFSWAAWIEGWDRVELRTGCVLEPKPWTDRSWPSVKGLIYESDYALRGEYASVGFSAGGYSISFSSYMWKQVSSLGREPVTPQEAMDRWVKYDMWLAREARVPLRPRKDLSARFPRLGLAVAQREKEMYSDEYERYMRPGVGLDGQYRGRPQDISEYIDLIFAWDGGRGADYIEIKDHGRTLQVSTIVPCGDKRIDTFSLEMPDKHVRKLMEGAKKVSTADGSGEPDDWREKLGLLVDLAEWELGLHR